LILEGLFRKGDAGESLGGAEATFGLFNVRLSDDGKS